MPGDSNVLHAQLLDRNLFVGTLTAAHVDYDAHAHLPQCFETIRARLASPKKIGRDFGKVGQADIILPAPHLALCRRIGRLGRLSEEGIRSNHEQKAE